MKVSVVIPTKNPGYLFREVLATILNQDVNYSYEVLIVDSGSTDGTIDYIKSIRDARVRLHSIDPSSFGHGRTRNLGISMTSGEYIALITQDALPANEHWLNALVSTIEQDPATAGVFGRHIAYPGTNPFTAHELELHFARFDSYRLVKLDDPERYTKDEGYRQMLHFFSDNNALIRRSVWESLPYPDVDFAEDQIWAKKIIEAGYKKAYARNAVVVHSHDYTLLERLQRSFDEAYAFCRLFGYTLCPDTKSLLRSWLALTQRDIRFARLRGLFMSDTMTVAQMPLVNFMRLAGYYLGTYGNRLPEWLRRFLSRDKRLMLGLHEQSTRRSSKL